MPQLILYLVMLICFALAAFNIGGRINLIAVGLTAWALALVWDAIP
ncbi:hypothetical protein [Nonomuraea typhae]|nr:hypothetical protein [Nonomuraea typhae]